MPDATSQKDSPAQVLVFVFRLRQLVRATLLGVGFAILLGGGYFLMQPAGLTVELPFQPSFSGVERGEYPNGLVFSTGDILSPGVFHELAAKHDIASKCTTAQFRSGFTVVERASGLADLRIQVEERLRDIRLTAVERQRIESDYEAKRSAIGRSYALLFVRPIPCRAIEASEVVAFGGDLLQEWLRRAADVRGVTRANFALLGPGLFESRPTEDTPVLAQAELLRASILLVIANIRAVEELPGADLVRAGERRESFAELRVALEDLLESRLDPFVRTVGARMDDRVLDWARQVAQTAAVRRERERNRAEAYRQALQEYSGRPLAPAQGDQLATDRESSFIQALTAVSGSSSAFRERLTDEAVQSNIAYSERSTMVARYEALVAAMRARTGSPLSRPEVLAELRALRAEAQQMAIRLGVTFDAYSRQALRSDSALAVVRGTPRVTRLVGFERHDLGLIVLLSGIVVPGVLFTLRAIGVYARLSARRLGFGTSRRVPRS